MKHWIVDLDGTLIKLNADWGAIREMARTGLRLAGIAYDSNVSMDDNLFALREREPAFFTELVSGIAEMEQHDLIRAHVNESLLRRLEGASWALFTANSKLTAQAVFQLPSFADVKPAMIIGKEDVQKPKPHPDGALRIVKSLGWAKKETGYLGDSDKDRDAARAAGLHFESIKF